MRRTALVEPLRAPSRLHGSGHALAPRQADMEKEERRQRRKELKQQRHELRVMLEYVKCELGEPPTDLPAPLVSKPPGCERADTAATLKAAVRGSRASTPSIEKCETSSRTAPESVHPVPAEILSRQRSSSGLLTGAALQPRRPPTGATDQSPCTSSVRSTHNSSSSISFQNPRVVNALPKVVLKRPVVDPLDIVPDHIIEGFRREWMEMQAAKAASVPVESDVVKADAEPAVGGNGAMLRSTARRWTPPSPDRFVQYSGAQSTSVDQDYMRRARKRIEHRATSSSVGLLLGGGP